MPIGVLENVIFSIIDLLKGAISITVPIFFILLVAQFLRKKIQEETKKSWLITAFLTTVLVSFTILLVVYNLPFLFLSTSSVGEVPSMFASDFFVLVGVFLSGVIKVFLVSIVLSFVLLPFEFIGVFFHSVICEKFAKYPNWLKLLATSYVSTVFASAVILFIFPEAITGFLYFLYF